MKQQWALGSAKQILGVEDTGGFVLVPRGDPRAVYFTTKHAANTGIISLARMNWEMLARELRPLKLLAPYSKHQIRIRGSS